MSDTPPPNGDTAAPAPTPEAHMTAAENWLALAEEAATARAELHAERDKMHRDPEEGDDLEKLEARFYRLSGEYDDQLEHAAILTRLHHDMATAMWNAPMTLTTMADTEMFERIGDLTTRVREQLAADTAAHEGARWHPGVDPEPPEDGALLTDDGHRFAFAVSPLGVAGSDVYHPFRWLIVNHYAQALRWRDGAHVHGRTIEPQTWESLDGKIGYADDAPLRRPTADERQHFYGPEPDPAPVQAKDLPLPHEEVACSTFVGRPGVVVSAKTPCERCGQDAWSHTTMAREALSNALAVHRNPAHTRAGRGPEYRGGEYKSPGGAGQWNG